MALKWKRFLKIFQFFLLAFIILEAFLFIIGAFYIHTDFKTITPKKTAVVLGTAKYYRRGIVNPYYKNRIAAASELYRKGKVKFILVSGDNMARSYDEPTAMRNDLIKLGVDPKHIYLDYAGFRTLDSIVRANKVFQEEDLYIVSQSFHCERALFISFFKNIKAEAVAAKGIPLKYGLKVQLRERVARWKMVFDLVFGVQPKYLGETIRIEEGYPQKK